MKYLAYWIGFLFLLTGCYPDMKPQLEEAEALLTENPDSAYRLLQSIERPERRQEAEYATWCLLMTQATDKSFREHTSDSLIRVAVRYFSKQHDPERLATALYTQGRVEKELGKNEEAARLFVKALDVAKGGEDYELQFLASSHLGTLYAYSHLDSLAFSAYEQALHFAELAQDSSSISYSHAYLGRVYGLQNNWHEAIHAYQKAIAIASQVQSIPALRLGLSELATAYCRIQAYQNAFDCLQRLQDLADKSLTTNQAITYLNIGDLYRLMGCYDLAIPYLEKALNTKNMYTKRSTYQCFYYLYIEQQNYKKAIEYNNLYWVCNDSIQKIGKQKEIIAVEKKYNNEKLMNEKQQLELKQSRMLLIGGGIFLLIIIVFLFIYADKKRIIARLFEELNNVQCQIVEKERAIIEYQQEVAVLSQKQSNFNDLQQIRNNMEAEIKLLHQQIKTLKQRQSELLIRLNRRNDQIQQYEKIMERKENIPDILTRIKKTARIEESEWPELIAHIDALHCQFSARLKKAYPELTDADIRLCCLIKLGYERKDQIALLALNEDSFDKRKQRLRKRIGKDKKWEKGELDSFIRSF